MRIIGYHASNGIIANSDGAIVTKPPFLDFLLEPKPDSIKVFYHIGYNVANLLAMIGVTEQEARKLYDTEQLYLTPYKLKYAPNKFLGLSKGFYRDNPFACIFWHVINSRQVHFVEYFFLVTSDR